MSEFVGAFDDLPAKKSEFAGAFDDLPDVLELAAKPKRDVGVGEAALRSFNKSADEFSRAITSIPGAIAIPFDYIGSKLGLNEPGAITNPAAVVPEFFGQRIEAERFKPTEQLDLPAQVGAGVGGFAGMLPELAAGGPARKAATVAGEKVAQIMAGEAPTLSGMIAQRVVPELVMSVPSTAVRPPARTQDLIAQGVDPSTASYAGAVTAPATMLGIAAPVSAAGGIVRRAATGGGVNVGIDMTSRVNENAILPGDIQQPYTAEDATTSGLLGAVLAAALGPRSAGLTRAQIGQNMSDSLDATHMREWGPYYDAQRPGAQLPLSDLLFQRTGAPDLAPAPQPGDVAAPPPVARGESAFAEPNAPVFARDSFITDEAAGEMVPVDGNPRRVIQPDRPVAGTPTGTEAQAGTLADLLGIQRDVEGGATRGAFDVAGATPPEPGDAVTGQRKRKQDAVDAPGLVGGPQRDLRDASAGGTTSPEGTAATSPESFNFLDIKRDKSGRVTGTGPQVEILQRGIFVAGKDGKQIPAVMIGFDDADGNSRTMVVPESRVGTLERPQSPRFAQDVAASTYAPPRGTGTEPGQPAPREAAQRITTRPGAEVMPGREGVPDLPPVGPDTFDAAPIPPAELPAPAPRRLAAPEPVQAPEPPRETAPETARPAPVEPPVAPTAKFAEYDGKSVTYTATVAGKKRSVTVPDAGARLREEDARQSSLQALLDCMKGKAAAR